MRFEGIRAKGLGVFHDEIAIDLAAIPGMLTAVVGPNGSGKSTLLELLFSAATRECPTRGSLVELARDRDAFLEVRLVNGASHTIRHVLDAVSKKSEALVLDAGGAPVLPTTSVKAFDEWASAHLPSPEVLLSSLFSAQQHGGFCDLSARGRKDVLASVLGIGAFEGMAERARKRASTAREDLAAIGGELRALPELDASAIDRDIEVARASATQADRDLADARAEQQAGTTYRAKAAALIADRAALADVDLRIANNRSCLVDAERIRAAATRITEIDVAIGARRGELTVARGRADELERSAREARGRAQRAIASIGDGKGRLAAARDRAALRHDVDIARGELPLATRHLETIERTLAEQEGALHAISLERLASADDRVVALRSSLEDIRDGRVDQGEIAPEAAAASRAITVDDERADAIRSAPARSEAARTALDATKRAVAQARAELTRIERVVARAGEVEAAEREIVAAKTAIDTDTKEESSASADALRLADESDRARGSAREVETAIGALEGDRDRLAPIARKLAPLAEAEAKLAGYEPRATELRAKIVETERSLADLPEPGDIDIDAIARRATQAHAAIGRLDGDRARAEETAARRTTLVGRQTAIEADLADWMVLADDLGATGLPALLIDAAGPELTALVNDLLHTCVGTRWTVSIETTRPSADGKKSIETCEIRVLDTEAGREAEVTTFSGGERAILGEAVSLALTMLACRRSGLEGPTLIRDETGAALDPENGRAYIAMLRKAAQIVGASRVLFVAHDRALQELADSRIVIAGGKVSVS